MLLNVPRGFDDLRDEEQHAEAGGHDPEIIQRQQQHTGVVHVLPHTISTDFFLGRPFACEPRRELGLFLQGQKFRLFRLVGHDREDRDADNESWDCLGDAQKCPYGHKAVCAGDAGSQTRQNTSGDHDPRAHFLHRDVAGDFEQEIPPVEATGRETEFRFRQAQVCAYGSLFDRIFHGVFACRGNVFDVP